MGSIYSDQLAVERWQGRYSSVNPLRLTVEVVIVGTYDNPRVGPLNQVQTNEVASIPS